MKRSTIIILVATVFAFGCGRKIPRDEHGNPIFKSEPMGEFTLTNCTVVAYYYTISNNIANRGSAKFVSDNPTPEQVKQFAVSTPVYFFIIHTNHVVSHLVKLEQDASAPVGKRFAFGVIGDPKKRGYLVQMPYTQTIADMRAAEIYHSQWKHDATMTKRGEKIFFEYNGETNEMLLFPTVINDLKKLIEDDKLYLIKD